MNTFNFQLKAWWFSILLLSAILLLNLLSPEIENLLDLKHKPIHQGQWWRILSSQVIHLSFNHTLLNFAGYAFVVFSFRDEIPPSREITILLISAIGVGLGIYFLNPEMYSYVGLSGAIYGVLVAYVIIGINKTPGLSFIFLAFMVGKFTFEYFNGGASSETEKFIGGRVASESHLYGAITGILPGIVFYLIDKKKLNLVSTQHFVDQFKDPVVRDLAWTLHSNPLLDIKRDNFQSIQAKECREIAQAFLPTLSELDKNPEKLIESVKPSSTRLGIYFERLIKFWLETQDRFQLITHNLKVEDEKITVGEFDFIIKDNLLNETIHWEVAVKFYLGIDDCCKANQFYGPGKKDRLDIKTEHLTSKQIQLSNQLAAKNLLQEKGINIDRRVLFVKGRLFYPAPFNLNRTSSPGLLSDSHLKSHWYTANEFLALKPSDLNHKPWKRQRFHIADRDEWLTFKCEEGITFTALKSQIERNAFEKPTIIIVSTSNKETSRFFIVPNDWAANLSRY